MGLQVGIGAVLLWLALFFTAVYGYVSNIITLVNWAGDMTAQFVVRVIGLFIPLVGVIMGFF